MKNKDTSLVAGSYIGRCSMWDWYDNSTIKVVDDKGGLIVRLDEWQTLVFFMADGSNDIEDIIASVLNRRGKLSTKEFRGKILASANELTNNLQVVKLFDKKKSIDYKYELTLTEQISSSEKD